MSWTEVPTTRREAGRFVQRARLDGGRSQIAFSLLLGTLARPGEIRSLARVELPPGLPAPLALPLALADVEVPVAVVAADPDSPWPTLVADATGAPLVDPPDAAQVVLLDGFGADDLLGLARGSDQDPDGGTRVAVACRALHRDGGADDTSTAEVVVELSGPGVDGVRRLGIDGLDRSVLDAVAEASARFPTGIDCWFVTPTGDIAAVPRSSHIEVLTPTPVDASRAGATTEEVG